MSDKMNNDNEVSEFLKKMFKNFESEKVNEIINIILKKEKDSKNENR